MAVIPSEAEAAKRAQRSRRAERSETAAGEGGATPAGHDRHRPWAPGSFDCVPSRLARPLPTPSCPLRLLGPRWNSAQDDGVVL